jgi:xanthine dehydrogenase accessory factor
MPRGQRYGPSMKIHQKVVGLIDTGRRSALATILGAEGSTPQRVGVKVVIEADGKIWGTLGGGLVDAEALKQV